MPGFEDEGFSLEALGDGYVRVQELQLLVDQLNTTMSGNFDNLTRTVLKSGENLISTVEPFMHEKDAQIINLHRRLKVQNKLIESLLEAQIKQSEINSSTRRFIAALLIRVGDIQSAKDLLMIDEIERENKLDNAKKI